MCAGLPKVDLVKVRACGKEPIPVEVSDSDPEPHVDSYPVVRCVSYASVAEARRWHESVQFLRNLTLAQPEDVAVWILEPRPASCTDLGDAADRLRRLVFLEGEPTRGKVANGRLDVFNLEVPHRLADVRLAAAHRELRSLARAKADGEWRLVEDRKRQLL